MSQKLDSNKMYGAYDYDYLLKNLFTLLKRDLSKNNLDLANVKLIRTNEPVDKYFLGGIYVGTTNQDHVLVAVYDDDRLNEQPLDAWLDEFEKIAISYDAVTVNKESSLDKDWGIYEAEFEDKDGKGYGTQIIIIKNEKVYLIQSMGLHSDIMQTDQKENFRFIIDSFEIINPS